MKRFFSMLAIIGFIAVSNCSRIPENNDPVLGIWVKAALLDENTSRNSDTSINEEWIFNDVYLGRYHRYSDNEIVFHTDFQWEVVNGIYTISYSEEDLPSVQVSIKNELLEFENGDVFATRK